MYEGVVTWNPLGGECPHKCIYCSSHKFMRYPEFAKKYSGVLRIDEKQINRKFKPGSTVFVVGQNDLFANDVPIEFIQNIIHNCKQNNVTYFFQTKNTDRLYDFDYMLPLNSIICTTIESNDKHCVYDGIVLHPVDRVKYFSKIKNVAQKQVTIEPIMKFDLRKFVDLIEICNPYQVNIGANSYKKVQLPEPTKKEILSLISELEKFTIVKKKSNLERLLK